MLGLYILAGLTAVVIGSGVGLIVMMWKNESRLVAVNVRMGRALSEISDVACGETQIDSDGVYDDGDGLHWIYKRIQALKSEDD